MNKLQLIKIALLTALLVEEVRNAKGGRIYKYKFAKGYGEGQPKVSVTNFGLSERTAKQSPKYKVNVDNGNEGSNLKLHDLNSVSNLIKSVKSFEEIKIAPIKGTKN